MLFYNLRFQKVLSELLGYSQILQLALAPIA